MGYTKLAVFDFDGTLFGSPREPRWYKSTKWWSDIDSLNPPIVPIKPGDEWWVEEIVNEAKKCLGDGDCYTVMMTGRPGRQFRYRISELLRTRGLNFDEVHFSKDSNHYFKLDIMKKLLDSFPTIETVELWDDTSELLKFYVSSLEKLGKKVIPHYLDPFSMEINGVSLDELSGVEDKKVLYSAVYIDSPDTIKAIWENQVGSELYKNMVADHITLQFDDVDADSVPLGKSVDFEINSFAENDKIQVFGVKIITDGITFKDNPHITVATVGAEVKNKDAGNLIKNYPQELKHPAHLSGVVAVSDGHRFYFKRDNSHMKTASVSASSSLSIIKKMRRMAQKLPDKQIEIMKFLSKVATEIGVSEHTYVVGGAVRDFYLGKPIKDVDVVIDAERANLDSSEFGKILASKISAKTDLTINKYGVAILSINGEFIVNGHDLNGEVIEIANARKESYGGAEGKGYKPTSIEKCKIEDDLMRREFTFNTLLMRLSDLENGPSKNKIVDILGAINDLDQRILRCPGNNPDKTFSDDPSRLLRVIKFMGKYNFTIPEDVRDSIKKNIRKLKNIPPNAVYTLLEKNIFNVMHDNKNIVNLMRDLGMVKVISEIYNKDESFKASIDGYMDDNPEKLKLFVELMNDNMFKESLNFLSDVQRTQFKEKIKKLNNPEAVALFLYLKRPLVNNKPLIDEFSLHGERASIIKKLAIQSALNNPNLVISDNREKIKDNVTRDVREKLKEMKLESENLTAMTRS